MGMAGSRLRRGPRPAGHDGLGDAFKAGRQDLSIRSGFRRSSAESGDGIRESTSKFSHPVILRGDIIRPGRDGQKACILL